MQSIPTPWSRRSSAMPRRRADPAVARAAREPVRFERLEQPRAHEYVAEQIRRQIVLRLIPAGQALPPERELAAMFGVGRATVQQAIRMLVDDHMVESRRGRHGGGNFVVGPDESRAGMDSVLAHLRRHSDEVREALEYRRAVEPAAAGLAAERRSRDDLRRLAEANDAASAADTDAGFMQWDTDFHLAVADAAGNRLYRQAMMVIRLELNNALIALPESPVWHERSGLEHEAIIAAISDRNAAAATEAMRAHVEGTRRSVEALLVALARRAKPGRLRG
jgi:GntR family transcriptional regulator, transcriptional repressor for pyruvate dehydrogenase complex